MVKAKKTKWSFLLRLLIISILFENFTVMNIIGASFKLYHVVAFLGLFFSLGKKTKFSKVGILYFLTAIVIPLLPLYRISDKFEFFKTYFIFFIFMLFLLLCFKDLKNEFIRNFNFYVRYIVAVVVFAAIFGIIQFVLNLSGITILNNIFGAREFAAQAVGFALGFRRVNSLFHEPSYFGFILCMGESIVLYSLDKKILKRPLLILSIIMLAAIMTFSTSTYILTFGIILLYFLVNHGFTIKKLFLFIALMLVLIYVFSFSDLSNVFLRYNEIGIENTSGYERVVTPALYVSKTMQHYSLLGRGMGQEGLIDEVGIIGRYPGVHNSLFGIFVILGLSALHYVVPVVKMAIKSIKCDKNSTLVIATLFGSYALTGAVLSFDTYMLLIITMLFMQYSYNQYRL